jgi:hypothetical protein
LLLLAVAGVLLLAVAGVWFLARHWRNIIRALAIATSHGCGECGFLLVRGVWPFAVANHGKGKHPEAGDCAFEALHSGCRFADQVAGVGHSRNISGGVVT